MIDKSLMILASGRYFDLADPDRYPPDLHDISFHLARINRFTGARSWTVCEHSIFVAEILRREGRRMELLGLLHDAHEAYTGDITRPLQSILPKSARAALQKTQERIQGAIYRALDVRPPDEKEAARLQAADDLALALEKRAFWPRDEKDWGLPAPSDWEAARFVPRPSGHLYPELFWLLDVRSCLG